MVKVEKGSGLGRLKGSGDGELVPSKCGSTQKMAANVKVVVRVRPMNERERERNSRTVVDVVDDKMLVFDPKEEDRPFFYKGVQQPTKGYLKRGNKELNFVFDHVCGQEASNNDVFETATKDMLSALMEGYNCSVFVYGATGAGKTFTMIGNKEHPGITYLTMEHLFSMINEFEKDREFDICVSYIEVYNENVYDLIKPSKTPLQLREDNKYGVMVAGLTLNNIKTARELLNMLENGNKNRTQHPTDANAESSRSHAVFQVYLKMSYKTSSQVRIVKLSMIDLAGSERASATGCVGERFKEGANINRSLLSLANCINRLADGSSYIPYRDSKLTRLLKDSLGGNCKTVMIANVSPSHISYEDTYNTLKYAARANKIQLSIKKNIVDGDMRLSQYVKINEELKKRVKELEAKLLQPQKDVDSKPVSTKLTEDLKKKVKELETKLTLSYIKIEKENNKMEDMKKKIQELQAKLSLSSLRDTTKEKGWRERILAEEESHSLLEQELLTLQSRRRVLALRHRLRSRAFTHVAELAHRSSTEAMEQMCNEDIPRQERAADSYKKQSLKLDAKILGAWTKWEVSRKKLYSLFNSALADCPDMIDFIEKIKMQSTIRQLEASDDLRHKLLTIENEEINAFTEYMSDMPNMLKKLYLTLKGYDRATPAMTAEYLEIMKKAKSAKGISWSDDDCSNTDTQFKAICTLNLEKPVSQEYLSGKRDVNSTLDMMTDSEDLTDLENIEPIRLSAKKRKGTPIKLMNNETIIINDSLESLDTTRTMNSAKKVKREFDASFDVENCGLLQPKDLNSTFDMAGKMEALKKQFKTDAKPPANLPVKRELVDRTNTMQRSVNFNSARVVKPVVGKALPQRRPATAARAGFGSSLSRDGTPLTRNVQAVRARERMQTHPYSRPTPLAQRK
ncbi:kinesin-like protein KIF18A isoform X2 [Pectinophora gossypiella]|uniref:kinesin-like protein KIF18A isoform X2 n=1 Tax=Pectinophora gossypiella TaxID=13191 RepID=UPI00214E12E2|nr:kinesin-like protein KIF18A isoform X2 [Pectinophora gossypiella]